jgi:hypothetical protein
MDYSVVLDTRGKRTIFDHFPLTLCILNQNLKCMCTVLGNPFFVGRQLDLGLRYPSLLCLLSTPAISESRIIIFKASLKANVRPDQISLKLIPLDMLIIGHSLTVLVLYIKTFLFWIFKKSSKWFAAKYKNDSYLLILQKTAGIDPFLFICWLFLCNEKIR